jgi:hypothetical protein
MNKQLIKGLLAGILAVSGLLLLGQSDASAAISGRCDNCHTMHNSQDGTYMTTGTSGEAQGYLLRSVSCIGCHTGEDGSRADNPDTNGPAVQHNNDPGSGFLAGGSFWYWSSAADDGNVHNVDEVDSDGDSTLTTPPGGTALASTFGCATGTSAAGYATTGCHLGSGHHSNVGGDIAEPTQVVWVDGGSVGSSYRFLSGVKGGEDGDWEFTKNARQHNVYYTSSTYNNSDTDTITSVCVGCHGDFHGSASGGTPVKGTGSSSPWIRHPTDISLYNATGPFASEHLSYNSYETITPIGTDTDSYANDISIPSGDMDTVYNQLNDARLDVVTCVSCHRAHGSVNLDLLRWSYNTMIAGGGGSTGCLKCHRQKN